VTLWSLSLSVSINSSSFSSDDWLKPRHAPNKLGLDKRVLERRSREDLKVENILIDLINGTN